MILIWNRSEKAIIKITKNDGGRGEAPTNHFSANDCGLFIETIGGRRFLRHRDGGVIDTGQSDLSEVFVSAATHLLVRYGRPIGARGDGGGGCTNGTVDHGDYEDRFLLYKDGGHAVGPSISGYSGAVAPKEKLIGMHGASLAFDVSEGWGR